jgi:hypothetical protein
MMRVDRSGRLADARRFGRRTLLTGLAAGLAAGVAGPVAASGTVADPAENARAPVQRQERRKLEIPVVPVAAVVPAVGLLGFAGYWAVRARGRSGSESG